MESSRERAIGLSRSMLQHHPEWQHSHLQQNVTKLHATKQTHLPFDSQDIFKGIGDEPLCFMLKFLNLGLMMIFLSAIT